MINEQFKCKGKFQMGQFKSLKQIFCKFESQIDFEGQGQGQVFRTVQDIYMFNAQIKFEVKIPMVQNLLHSQEIKPNLQVLRTI